MSITSVSPQVGVNVDNKPLIPKISNKHTYSPQNSLQKNLPYGDTIPAGNVTYNLNHTLDDKISQTFTHTMGLTSEIVNGTHHLKYMKLHPIDIIAEALNSNPKDLMDKVGNSTHLKNTYKNGLKFAGIASIATGLASLMQLTAGIVDIYQDRHYKNDTDTETRRTVMRDINVGTDLLSATGNLIGVKGMASALTNPQAISQAVSALGGGAVTSAHTVTAIHMGIGLLAAGITIGSLATLLNCGHYLAHRFNGKINDDNAMSKHSDAISGTTQLLNGVGNMALLITPSGYATHALFTGNPYMNSQWIKRLTWLSTGSMMLGGTQSVVNAFSQKNKNRHSRASEAIQSS
jgi:hypothetical protein